MPSWPLQMDSWTMLGILILSSLCHSWGNFKFFSLSFLRYFGLIISCIWLCKDELCSKDDFFLCSDIYPISVIFVHTLVGNWDHIIFPSLSILFPWYDHKTMIKASDTNKFKISSTRKLISPFLNVQTTNNLSNLCHDQIQAELLSGRSKKSFNSSIFCILVNY